MPSKRTPPRFSNRRRESGTGGYDLFSGGRAMSEPAIGPRATHHRGDERNGRAHESHRHHGEDGLEKLIAADVKPETDPLAAFLPE